VSSQLDALRFKREEHRIHCERILTAAQRAGRDSLTPAEQRALDELRTVDDRIAHLEREDHRAGHDKVQALQTRIDQNSRSNSMRNRPGFDNHLTYRQADSRGEFSWLRDMVRMHCGWDDSGESRRRLEAHAHEVRTMPEYMEFRDLSRVDGQGGYAVPPAWLMNQYIELARPGRAFANLVQRQPLPGSTDSVNIPKILTGTAVGVQSADNAVVTDVDLTDTFINAPVRTISGQQGVAIQLIDQSPIAFDDVVFRDLVAAHAAATDQQVLSGTGSNGQVLGVNFTPNIQTIAVSSVDVPGVYSAIANAVQLIHTNRFLPPEVIVMHPRRWGWLLSQLDDQHRPLFLPQAQGPWNAGGILTDVASQQVVGSVQGLPVVTDPNITTISGIEYQSYGDEDVIYVLRASDLILWESGIRARVLPETKAANLTVLLQIFSYLAFSAARYPASVVTVTGLSQPVW
jgi:HK97 family phage major capsid protein